MRARILKPDFFRDEDLAVLPVQARLLFSGLWCIADREGRLEDRPIRIKADVFPYDDCTPEQVNGWIEALSKHWLVRYTVGGKRFIQVVAFKEHQRCHRNEAQSSIPPPPKQAQETVQGNTMDVLEIANGSPRTSNGSPRCSVIGNRYTEAEAVTVGGTPSADLSDIATEMYQRHKQGRKTTLIACQQAIVQKVGNAVDPLSEAMALNARHRGWCASTDWTKKGGEYTPWLDQWIIGTKADAEPPAEAAKDAWD